MSESAARHQGENQVHNLLYPRPLLGFGFTSYCHQCSSLFFPVLTPLQPNHHKALQSNSNFAISPLPFPASHSLKSFYVLQSSLWPLPQLIFLIQYTVYALAIWNYLESSLSCLLDFECLVPFSSRKISRHSSRLNSAAPSWEAHQDTQVDLDSPLAIF